MKKRIIIIAFFSLLFIVITLVYIGQRNARLKVLYYSGSLEATQAELSFQTSGKVVNVLVDEGESVKKDQILALLDKSEFQAGYEQVKANLDASRKNLQQAELTLDIYRKILPVEVERAEAGVDGLRARVAEMESGYRVQDIEKGKLALSALKTALEVAQKDKERYDRLFNEKIVSEKERDAVDLRFETVLNEYESARANFEQLEEGFRKESVRASRAKLAEGEAVLKQARSNLKKIEITEKEVEAALARVQASEAALRLAETRLGFTELTAPFKGIVVSRNVEPGEVISPGREVFSLADLSIMDLKIFVDETDIGRVKPGQKTEIKVDSFPKKVFEGKVAFISPEAEFTPKIIQTRKERVKLVYLVKVLIPNTGLDLKPGMPADATLR
ncbi:efflux RND transporter periplasmic adaptor subunit [Deltaproteobacteria bacterium]|nr:efflux RND transporter periplasmic adaptor subunit [Deltaproteobacteria bacterium]